MIFSNFEMNEIFNRILSNQPNNTYYKTTVLSNDSEKGYEINYTKDGVYLHLEVPGFNKFNLNVELDNGQVFVEGKRTYKLNGENVTRKVNKKFSIGDGFNPESLEATVEDGLLTLFVPNMKKEDKKKINIL